MSCYNVLLLQNLLVASEVLRIIMNLYNNNIYVHKAGCYDYVIL